MFLIPPSIQFCQDNGADLAKVTNRAQNDFLANIMPTPTSRGYLGGFAETAKEFVWTKDGQEVI